MKYFLSLLLLLCVVYVGALPPVPKSEQRNIPVTLIPLMREMFHNTEKRWIATAQSRRNQVDSHQNHMKKMFKDHPK